MAALHKRRTAVAIRGD